MGLGFHPYTEENRRRTRRRRTELTTKKTMGSQLGLIEQSFDVLYTSSVREALDELPDNFTITDPYISGHPIVFASGGFLKMSGYPKDEVIGKNGKIFQGSGTNRRSVMEIREAIQQERTIQISLLNYRRDGSPFWMLFHLSPVFSKDDGRVVHFVGVQVPISRKSDCFRSGFGRNGYNLGEDQCRLREIVFGSCRREVCTDASEEPGCVRVLNSSTNSECRVLEIEEYCEASALEKQKAETAINSILSVLTHYSELTGRLVCGQRCISTRMGLLGSSLNISLGRIKQSFVLILHNILVLPRRTDPRLPDMPIVYASDAFLKLTGYERHEVLGRNCRFLSGADTDAKAIAQIRESIRTEQACTVRILNYRKDRSSFWNLLHISPVRNATGKIACYVGIQMEEDGKKNEGYTRLSPEMRQLGAVGAVKVAVRTLSIDAGPSK